jgi:hypothetical protein
VTRIHVLAGGFDTPNGRAFLFPLLVWRRALREQGLDIAILSQMAGNLTDCDVLLVDSKVHRGRWLADKDAVLEKFTQWAGRCRVIYCDTTDSSGSLLADLLPVVHGYAKSQLIRDRAVYRKSMYGHRPFSDFYHRERGITDSSPEWSQVVADPALLAKLRVSWNSGLADYSLYGPRRMALYQRLPLPGLLRFPKPSRPPSAVRTQDVSCRFGTDYPRASVSFQRRMIREKLAGRIDTRKLSRRQYFRELENSKFVVSPFGYGEITLKDFEVFLSGGLLVKPNMTHMDTWPDLFRGAETMLTHHWDLSDFEAVLDDAVTNYPRYVQKAQAGQEAYSAHTSGPDAPVLFARQLRNVIAQVH